MAKAETSVNTFFGKLVDAWGANDGKAVAGLFTETGSLINPFGERADGRAALTEMYTGYFSGLLKGTTTSVRLTQLRPIEASYAFADVDQAICAPDGQVIMDLHVVNLLQKQGDDWLLVDSRPYAFSSPPA
ncbi:MAG TPA: SgcJ/EcaC family oxidoreductase [Acidimicrobiales bacterium]|nr:SgcJ/EcaC family oxidoreductase [Acidimicrobiales bacterium]